LSIIINKSTKREKVMTFITFSISQKQALEILASLFASR